MKAQRTEHDKKLISCPDCGGELRIARTHHVGAEVWCIGCPARSFKGGEYSVDYYGGKDKLNDSLDKIVEHFNKNATKNN